MTLTFVEPTARTRFSALLYGPEGSWKSTGATSAPGPILYLNTDRKDGIAYGRRLFGDKDIRESRPESLSDLHETIFYIREHPEVQTVVVDTIGRLFDLVLRSHAKNDKRATTPEIGEVMTDLERFVELLLEEDVNVVLLAHDMSVEASGAEADGTLMRELMPMCGTSKPFFPRKLMRLVSIVGYCGVVGDGEQRRGVAQLVEMGGRRAKDGTGALAGEEGVRVVDLTEWAETVAAFYAPAAEKTSKDKES